MRTIFKLFVLAFCLPVSSVYSQIVTEEVVFDTYSSPTNHDFVNYFDGGLGLTQLNSNGIIGGCLETPNTVNWGNDNAIYCSKYIASPLDYSETRIAFKYDSTQINSANFDRAVSLFLRPSADFNHYVIASVNYDKRLQITSYSWANNPPLLTLLHGNWYQLVLITDFVSGNPNYQVNVTAKVDDLGPAGLNFPITIGNSNGSFNDSLLVGDTAVQVSFTATLWGGAKYIDNFHFEGVKSADSCLTIPTSLSEMGKDKEMIFPNPFKDVVTVNTGESSLSEITIYDGVSKKLLSREFSNEITLNLGQLASGTYFYELKSKGKAVRKGVIIKE